MSDKNNINKVRRLSKGQRMFLRQLKQAAGKDPTILRSIIKKGSSSVGLS